MKVECRFMGCRSRHAPCPEHPWSSWERLVRGRSPVELAGWTWRDTFFLLQVAALWIAVAVALGER